MSASRALKCWIASSFLCCSLSLSRSRRDVDSDLWTSFSRSRRLASIRSSLSFSPAIFPRPKSCKEQGFGEDYIPGHYAWYHIRYNLCQLVYYMQQMLDEIVWNRPQNTNQMKKTRKTGDTKMLNCEIYWSNIINCFFPSLQQIDFLIVALMCPCKCKFPVSLLCMWSRQRQ